MKNLTRFKICKYHGVSLFYNNRKNDWICNYCKNERATEARRKYKLMAIQYKGGKCEKCGYKKSQYALEFHHILAGNKEFGIGSKVVAWEKLKKELDKCMLLCANYHRETHSKLHIEKMKLNKKINPKPVFPKKFCPVAAIAGLYGDV